MTSLLPNGMQTFLDENGDPLAAGTVWFYELDGTTPKDTWQDPDHDTLNDNPLTLDAAGRATIWGDGWYRQIVRKASVTIDPEDGELVWDKPIFGSTGITVVMENTVDGAGGVASTGISGDLYVPFDCTLSSWVIQSIQSGSIEFDVWLAPFVVGAAPTVANTICAGNYPALVASVSDRDQILSGWNIDVPADSHIRFNVRSITSIVHCVLTLTAARNPTT